MSFNSNTPYASFSNYPQYHFPQSPNASLQRQPQQSSSHIPHYANTYSFTTNGQDMSIPGAVGGAVASPLSLGSGQASSGATQLPYSMPTATLQRPVAARPPSTSQSVTSKNASLGPFSSQPDSLLPPPTGQPESATSVNTYSRNEPTNTAASDLEEGGLSDGISARDSVPTSSSQVQDPRFSRRNREQRSGSRDDGREIARKALRELRENKINFSIVAEEVVDEELSAASLRKLYSEIGVWISPADLAAASVYDTRPRQQTATAAKPRDIHTPSAKLHDHKPAPVAQGANEHSLATTDKISEVPAIEKQATSSMTSPTSIRSGDAVISSTAASKPHVSVAATSSGKPSVAKSNDKAFDRKDYIARMLAAKAGKTLPAAESIPTENSSPRLVTVPQTSPENEVLPTLEAKQDDPQMKGPPKTPGDDDSSGQVPNVVDPVENTGPSVRTRRPADRATDTASIQPVEHTDPQAKKKAQTELARQKIEALRSRENAQRKDRAEHGSTVVVKESVSTLENPLPALAPLEKSAISDPATVHADQSSHSSSFSPVSGKPLFSLPGLFMSNEHLASGSRLVNSSQSSLVSGTQAAPASQALDPATPSVSLPPTSSLVQSVTASSVPSKLTDPVESGAIKYPSTETVKSNKKRQKASDFIEPPSTRIKRHLGLSEDKGVVIEVSEDEAMDGFAEDAADMDIDTDQDLYGTSILNSMNPINSQQKRPSIVERRDSELNRHFQSAALATPPLPVTPRSNVEFDGLRSKEREIELMNKRIAELEQRKKAKQASSRAPTPNLQGNKSPSPKAYGSVLDTTEQSQTAIVPGETISTRKQLMSKENLGGTPPEAHQGDHADGLLLGEDAAQLEEQSAKTSEAEQAREAEAHRAKELERQAEELERNRKDFEQQQAKELEERQARQIEEERKRKLEEQRTEELERQRSNEWEQARVDAERQHAQELEVQVERQKRLERRAAIEAGLPILDAEVEKTEQKLLFLRRQVEELELELERGIKGRRDLVVELQGLRTSPNAPAERITYDGLDDSEEGAGTSDSIRKYMPLNPGF